MNCKICRGACCETFQIPNTIVAPGDDHSRWLALHATNDGRWLTFEARCTQLTFEGSCAIYDNRPLVCATYTAGGKQCLETVRIRRTSEQYQQIRNSYDPEVIHGN